MRGLRAPPPVPSPQSLCPPPPPVGVVVLFGAVVVGVGVGVALPGHLLVRHALVPLPRRTPSTLETFLGALAGRTSRTCLPPTVQLILVSVICCCSFISPPNLTTKKTQNPFPTLSSPRGADVKQDRNNRSKGWGIVKFNTIEEAMSAIAAMNATECEGRAIEVRMDRGAAVNERGELEAYA